MRHLFAIERLEARGHQSPTHADEVLRAAFNFLDAVAPEEADALRVCVGRKPKRRPAPPALPLFAKLATGAEAAELADKAGAVDARPSWPHGFDHYRQRVYYWLETHHPADPADAMPWPSGEQIQDAMRRGILPGDYAAALIRADLARA